MNNNFDIQLFKDWAYNVIDDSKSNVVAGLVSMLAYAAVGNSSSDENVNKFIEITRDEFKVLQCEELRYALSNMLRNIVLGREYNEIFKEIYGLSYSRDLFESIENNLNSITGSNSSSGVSFEVAESLVSSFNNKISEFKKSANSDESLEEQAQREEEEAIANINENGNFSFDSIEDNDEDDADFPDPDAVQPGTGDDYDDDSDSDEEPESEGNEPVSDPEQKEEAASDSEHTANTESESDKLSDEEREKIKADIKKIFGGRINDAKKSIKSKLSSLYRVGFEGLGTGGVYVNVGNSNSSPIVYIGTSGSDTKYTIRRKNDEGTYYDIKVFDALSKIVPDVCSCYNGDFIPSYKEFNEGAADQVWFKLQLAFQSANIQYCTGDVSIRHWITTTQLKNESDVDEWLEKNNSGGKTKLHKFSDVIKWYDWCIEKIIYRYLIDAGVRGFDQASLLDSILQKLFNAVTRVALSTLRSFKNIEGQPVLIKEEMSISSLEANSESLRDKLSQSLNLAGSDTIGVEAINDGNVCKIKIIYNKEEANKNVLFAGDIIDDIIKSGNAPSWDHALLGQKPNGELFFWDRFMGAPGSEAVSDFAYALYAGSGSGKGIMTSTIVASALCGGLNIFYTDGKPENGAALGRIAWKNGKEAYVFDGKSNGAVPFDGEMERFSNGVRHDHTFEGGNEIYSYVDSLPNALFEGKKGSSNIFSNKAQMNFLGYMRYVKSLRLYLKLVLDRAEGRLKADDWQLWIFDEMTSMAVIEADIRKNFLKYILSKDVTKVTQSKNKMFLSLSSTDKKTQELVNSGDEGILFINEWCEFMEKLAADTLDVLKIHLRKSKTNVLFIFQNASWLNSDESTKDTSLACIARNFGESCLKIIGKDGLADNQKHFGTADTRKKEWYSTNVQQNKCFAISNTADLRTDSTAFPFKPYNLFTIKIDSEKKITEQPAPNDDDYTKYIDGYCTKLLNAFGKDPSEILNNAYEYANYAVQTLGWASNIKEYIYDGSKFISSNENNSLSNLKGRTIFEAQRNDEDDESSESNGASNGSSNGVADIPLSGDDTYSGRDEVSSSSAGTSVRDISPESVIRKLNNKYRTGLNVNRNDAYRDYALVIIHKLEGRFDYILNHSQVERFLPLVIQYIKDNKK